MGKDRPRVELTPSRLQVIEYITVEGAVFNQELAEVLRLPFEQVDSDLKYLGGTGIVDRVPSVYFPDHRWADIFKATEGTYELMRKLESNG